MTEGRRLARDDAETPEERASHKRRTRWAKAALRDLTLREAELIENTVPYEDRYRLVDVARPGKMYVVLRCDADGTIA